MNISPTTPPLSPVISPNPLHPMGNLPNGSMNGAMTVVHNVSESLATATPGANSVHKSDTPNIEQKFADLKLNPIANNTIDLSDHQIKGCKPTVIILPRITCCHGGINVPGGNGEIGLPGVPGGNGEIGIPGVPGGTGEIGVPGVPGGNGEIGVPGVPGGNGGIGIPGVPGGNGEIGLPGVPGGTGNIGIPGLPGGTGEISHPEENLPSLNEAAPATASSIE